MIMQTAIEKSGIDILKNNARNVHANNIEEHNTMLKKLEFKAKTEPLTMGLDLIAPKQSLITFEMSGDCDMETLKKITRLLKREVKADAKQ